MTTRIAVRKMLAKALVPEESRRLIASLAGESRHLMDGTTEWRKSSGSNCVEAANQPAAVGVRDSKNVPGPTLAFRPAAWSAFLRRVR